MIQWTRFALLFLLATSPAYAQSHTLAVSQYLHTSWTSQEGYFKAGISGINSVAQTSDGYLWMQGTGGLLRFDGVRFVEWQPPANDSLPKRPLHRLLGSRDGSLWIAGTGLAELKANGEFRRYHQFDGMPIEELLEDKDGGIWVAQQGGQPGPALCVLHRGESECFPVGGPLGSWAQAMHEDSDGELWVITGSGVWRVRPGPPRKLASTSAIITSAFALNRDASGTLIFTTGNFMNMVTADGKIQPYPLDVGQARALLKDREGDLWVGTNGQGIIHVHDGLTDRFTTSDGLSSNTVVHLFQDREGNVWAGTTRGLDKFTKPAVPSLTTKQGLSNDYVNSVLTDVKGVSWVGTLGGLNQLIDGRAIKSTVKLPSDEITSLFETSRGRMIVATGVEQGVVRLDANKTSPLRSITAGNVFQIGENLRGDLWVASRESGVQHLRDDGSVIEAFDKVMLEKRNIALAFDPKREGLWLTSNIGGLGFLKDGKLLERYSARDGLGDGILRDPQVDDEGGVWVGTRVGLAHLKDGKISVLSRKNGLPCDAVHWMRKDRDHNVWLYTECGLVQFPQRELSSWISDHSHTLAITRYLDNTDGVENVAYNGWYTPQTSTTPDGRILFATTAGLSILDPHNLNQNASPPPVHIEEITADDKDIKRSDRATLPVRVRSIHFAYTALSFVAPRKVLFRYKLQGFDKDWSSPVSFRQATYTNLPPGNYKFQVIACNNDGVWNTTGDNLSFIIPPAFYQTIWFWCLAAISVLDLFWILYARRMRRVTAEINSRLGERLQERERIARELHDSLLQDFQVVILRFQVIAKRLGAADPNRAAMENGLDYADKVLSDGRNQIRDIRADTNSMDELSKALAAYGEELADVWPQTFHLTLKGKQFEVNAIVRDEIYRIGREALGNAFKHSHGSAVEVEIAYLATKLLMRVSDDGSGIDPEIAATGRTGHWGIANMRERAQKIGAELKISSTPNRGSQVELTISLALAKGESVSRFPWQRKNSLRNSKLS